MCSFRPERVGLAVTINGIILRRPLPGAPMGEGGGGEGAAMCVQHKLLDVTGLYTVYCDLSMMYIRVSNSICIPFNLRFSLVDIITRRRKAFLMFSSSAPEEKAGVVLAHLKGIIPQRIQYHYKVLSCMLRPAIFSFFISIGAEYINSTTRRYKVPRI